MKLINGIFAIAFMLGISTLGLAKDHQHKKEDVHNQHESHGHHGHHHEHHKSHTHVHKKECGHKASKHGDHTDYAHSGHQHHQAQGHTHDCEGKEDKAKAN